MKSTTTIFKDFSVALGIVVISFMPYLHDFDMFKGVKGFSGFSSLRVALWAVSLYVVALAGWIFAFIASKGKRYRFMILAPVFMLAFQLSIYLLDARKSTVNDFTTKTILNFIFCLLLVGLYFYRLKNNDK